MRQLNGVYTQAFNKRHRKTGHVFQGRYKAIVVDRDAYLLELSRYIILNPVRAKLAATPEEYRWTSYGATAGLSEPPPFLSTDWILPQFSQEKTRAYTIYRGFVKEGITRETPWKNLEGQIFLGDKDSVKKVFHAQRAVGTEVPRRQRYAHRPPLSALFSDVGNDTLLRNERIWRGHIEFGYSLKGIGDSVGLHYTTVSKIVKAGPMSAASPAKTDNSRRDLMTGGLSLHGPVRR